MRRVAAPEQRAAGRGGARAKHRTTEHLSGIEIATLFARINANVDQYAAAMQAADRDLALRRIADAGLDVALDITKAESRKKAGEKTDGI